MVIVGGTFEFDADKRDPFLASRTEMMRVSRAEPGCIEYTFAADPLDPGQDAAPRQPSCGDSVIDRHLRRQRREAARLSCCVPHVRPVGVHGSLRHFSYGLGAAAVVLRHHTTRLRLPTFLPRQWPRPPCRCPPPHRRLRPRPLQPRPPLYRRQRLPSRPLVRTIRRTSTLSLMRSTTLVRSDGLQDSTPTRRDPWAA